jgi:7-cyano-7-deazaguanine reductase
VELKALGASTDYKYEKPDIAILEKIPNPFAGEVNKHGVIGTIHVEAPEFTSICPVTGQPDFGTIVIDYQPDQYIVESKSLKLYLGTFRMHGDFHESCVNRIANDLVSLLQPFQMTVTGEFTPRGGISLWPKAEYVRAKE